ncbi:hypothetical protein TNCV_1490071 [Trichonephila clavipes]|nr:hypothetical protein TNCV_1490071 [Trichonephila clavipes]
MVMLLGYESIGCGFCPPGIHHRSKRSSIYLERTSRKKLSFFGRHQQKKGFLDNLYRLEIADSNSCPLSDHGMFMTGDHLNIFPTVLYCISLNIVDCAFDDCRYRFTLHWAARRLMSEKS